MHRTVRWTLALMLIATGCRSRSELGDFQPSLDGAAEMTRSFWIEVISGDMEAAERRLASEEEIASSLRIWATAMNEPLDEDAVRKEAAETRARLLERWEAYRTGKEKPPRSMTAESLRKADILVTNKMLLSPDVCFVQRLTLTGVGVDPVDARVAGAVKMGKAPWKILWLP